MVDDQDFEQIKNLKQQSKEIAENMLERHKRSASALRENLAKRKAQIKMMHQNQPKTDPPSPASQT